MISITVPKMSLLVGLLLCLFASLVLVACRPVSTTAGEINLVWEAWGIIKSTYVEGDSLDSGEATGNIILEMLDAGERSAYPFLTELDDVRGRPAEDVPGELTDVWKAWVLFHEKWPEVDAKVLANAAIDGMLDTLGDESAVHLTAEAYDRAQERLKGSYHGIGASVMEREGDIVLSPMGDSPAQKAGLAEGDVVLAVDGHVVEGESLGEVVERVRGPSGTKVTLLVERLDEEEPIELNVIRDDIHVDSVRRTLFPGAIGYIYIADFLEHTPDEVVDFLEELKQVDMLALVLDLRGNPGASIESARKVASQFLSEGIITYEMDRQGNRRDWLIEEGGLYTDAEKLPMVVIVNALTADAAEAAAGGLQDAGRAKILGTSTAGKASASVFVELTDGSAIYVPTSYWYTPSGQPIHGPGIQPNIQVPLTVEDRMAGLDSQLARAFQYLDELLPQFR